jgi:hypothetical protein
MNIEYIEDFVPTEHVLEEEGYEEITSVGDDCHAFYYEASLVDGAHEFVFDIKRTLDGDFYRREQGNEDWHYMFTVSGMCTIGEQ